MKVTQPKPNPTNKLSAAAVSAAVMELAKVIVQNIWPNFYDPALWAALTPLVILGVGYLVKDEDNTP